MLLCFAGCCSYGQDRPRDPETLIFHPAHLNQHFSSSLHLINISINIPGSHFISSLHLNQHFISSLHLINIPFHYSSNHFISINIASHHFISINIKHIPSHLITSSEHPLNQLNECMFKPCNIYLINRIVHSHSF